MDDKDILGFCRPGAAAGPVAVGGPLGRPPGNFKPLFSANDMPLPGALVPGIAGDELVDCGLGLCS